MKVLYIGHYKEFGGWGQAATDYILALDQVGVDVVCRNVTLTRDRPDVDPRILKLEQKSAEGCTVCIQHVLPHHIEKTDAFDKNIAFFAGESTSIKHLPWLDHLQLVDQVWVPNSQLKESLEQDGIGVSLGRLQGGHDAREGVVDAPVSVGVFKVCVATALVVAGL